MEEEGTAIAADGRSLADARQLLKTGSLRPPALGENTTLGVVATNATLTLDTVQLNLQFLIPFLFMFPFCIFQISLLILFLIADLLIVSWMNTFLVQIIFRLLLFLQ